ncbi:MAG: class D beta-lactamase [Bacteroidales bacterium]|nr:class D beta-lactamase [Bacteroidales bacterium]
MLVIGLFSCHIHPSNETGEIPREKVAVFDSILAHAGVEGSVLIFDQSKNILYSNDFDWADVGRLPASTFKIVNSIVALESGVVDYDTTIFRWNGKKRRLKQWEQNMNLREAFHLSCVPCYQQIALTVGPERMKKILEKLNYGNMVVDSTNIDRFWLEGDSKVSQVQQIDFLERFYDNKLPIANSSFRLIKEMMVIDSNQVYKLSGKTGWSIRNGNNNGWFVGYLEKGDEVFFFATNVSPHQSFDMKLFPVIRKEITMKAFQAMGFIKE